MNARYVVGIVIALILLSVNQIFIQYWLAQKKSDANSINIAGKQRMLSQRINTEFYKIKYENASPDLLHRLFSEWKTAHAALQADERIGKGVLVSDPKIRFALKELNTNVDFIESQINDISRQTFDLGLITENQNYFLPRMNQIVKSLERSSDKKLQFIVRIEYLLFFLSLVILTLEVLYIYMPIERALKKVNNEVSEKNEALNIAVNNIEKKNRELEQITYITSHDLQEPVRTVNSIVNLFKVKYSNSFDEQGLKMLDFLDGATLRMRDLIKDLLEYSIIGKKKETTNIDCEKLLKDITDDLAHRINSTDAKITWSAMPHFFGIKAEIRLLFQNLISNALKFQQKEKKPQIKITSFEKEDCWMFTVADNGIGIESEHLDKVFSIFHRIHSRNKFEGTGIGLAHCAKIVDIHDGEIWVESKPGEGSTFFFTIKKALKNNERQNEKETELNLVN